MSASMSMVALMVDGDSNAAMEMSVLVVAGNGNECVDGCGQRAMSVLMG